MNNYYINYINHDIIYYNNLIQSPPSLIEIEIVCEPFDIDSEECSICMESKEKSKFCKLTCDHIFCTNCIGTIMTNQTRSQRKCALCREPIKKIITMS
jgi:hypothetical protein